MRGCPRRRPTVLDKSTLQYVITDFRDMYRENYDLQMDFSVQEQQVQLFREFLEGHRELITDAKIFNL